MKHFKKVFALLLFSSFALSAIGCNNKSGGANTLDIFATNAGYGIEWITKMVSGFKNASWVKEKYPELTVNFGKGDYDTGSNIGSKITAGTEKANRYDLLFTCNPCGDSYGSNMNTSFYEELSDVYNGAIPGEANYDGSEGKQLKDKMIESVYEANKTQFPNDDNTYFLSFPWVVGTQGIVYNKTKLESYISNYEIPRTTNELINLLSELAPLMKADDDYPWLTMNGGDYNDGTITQWWAQYEGIENYNRFFEGKDENGQYSSINFTQTGRLRALQALENLYQEDFIHPDSYLGIKKFMTIQNRFIRGIDGVFMLQGDWFENENNDTPTDQVFDLMKTPILSSLIEKCLSINTDSDLSLLVKCIDENKSYEETKAVISSLVEDDYNLVKNSRSVEYMLYGHQAHIPNYSSAKEVAKDFLRFMASDQGIEIMIKAGKGYQTGFKYEPSEDFFNENYSVLQKSHYKIMKNANVLKPKSSFILFNFGGLIPWKTNHPEQVFTSTLARDHKTAQQVFDEEVEYYTKDNSANFKNILKQAGINY